jgi:hypothetical protein
MGEDVRKGRPDIQLLLFRRLMQETGGIIVGEIATAFFTGATPAGLYLDLVLCNCEPRFLRKNLVFALERKNHSSSSKVPFIRYGSGSI